MAINGTRPGCISRIATDTELEFDIKGTSTVWHHLYIDDPAAAYATSKMMKEATRVAIAATKNYDAALFSRLDAGTGGVHYYFAPGAAAIATAFKASPCEKPPRAAVGALLVGAHGSAARLFPGEAPKRRQ